MLRQLQRPISKNFKVLGQYQINFLASGRLYTVTFADNMVHLNEITHGTMIYKEEGLPNLARLFTKQATGEDLEIVYQHNAIKKFKDYRIILKMRSGCKKTIDPKIPPETEAIAPKAQPAIILQYKPLEKKASPDEIEKLISTVNAQAGYSLGKIVKEKLQQASALDQTVNFLEIYDLVKTAAFVGGRLQSMSAPLTQEVLLSIKQMTQYDFIEACQNAECFFQAQQRLSYPTVSMVSGTLYHQSGKRKTTSPSLEISPLKLR